MGTTWENNEGNKERDIDKRILFNPAGKIAAAFVAISLALLYHRLFVVGEREGEREKRGKERREGERLVAKCEKERRCGEEGRGWERRQDKQLHGTLDVLLCMAARLCVSRATPAMRAEFEPLCVRGQCRVAHVKSENLRI